jgi:hypothetical protein
MLTHSQYPPLSNDEGAVCALSSGRDDVYSKRREAAYVSNPIAFAMGETSRLAELFRGSVSDAETTHDGSGKGRTMVSDRLGRDGIDGNDRGCARWDSGFCAQPSRLDRGTSARAASSGGPSPVSGTQPSRLGSNDGVMLKFARQAFAEAAMLLDAGLLVQSAQANEAGHRWLVRVEADIAGRVVGDTV